MVSIYYYYSSVNTLRGTSLKWGLLILICALGEIMAMMMYLNTKTSSAFATGLIVFPIVGLLAHLRHRAKISRLPWYVYPTFWITVSIFMIFFLTPLITIYGSTNIRPPFEDWNWEVEYGSTLMLGSISLFALLLGSIRTNTSQIEYSIFPRGKFWKSNVNQLTSILLIFYGVLGYLVWIKEQGGLNSIFSNRNQLQAQGFIFNNGYLYDSLLVVTGVLTALLARKRSLGFLKPGIIEIGILLTMLPYIARGDRSVFLYTLTVVAIIYSLTSKTNRVRFKTKLIILFLIPLMVVTPRIYRHADTFSLASIKNGYSISNITETVTGLDTAMVPALTILRSQLGVSIDYQLGKSYVKGLFKPLPRAIWKNKPMELDRQLNLTLFPRTSQQVGFSFSGLSEPLVNFGLFGVITFFFVLGRLENRITNFRKAINPHKIISLAWVSGFMFILIRGNLSTDYQRLLFPLIPALISIRKTNEIIFHNGDVGQK